MNKIIEELAKQYAKDMCSAEDYTDGSDDEEYKFDMLVCFDDAKSVLGWIFNKSLDMRLTDNEKACVRGEYANTYPNDLDCGATNILIQGVLERIFGKDFFKEDKL